MGVIFSPFVAFALNGRVDGSNWTPAIATASLCLACLAAMTVRAGRNYRRIPAEIRAEYSHGRLVPPLPATTAGALPIEYAPHQKGQPLVGLIPNGVWFAPSAVAGMSWRRFRGMVDTNLKAHLAGGADMPAHAIDWNHIAEWQVLEGSDGPDYYRLMLDDDTYVNLKRPDDPAKEAQILDYVRAVGVRPVRLFCDIA